MIEAETSEEMFDKERELVELGPHSYNLKEGGSGGFDYINSNPKLFLTEKRLRSLMPIEDCRSRLKEKLETDSAFKERIASLNREKLASVRNQYPKSAFFQKTHREDSKKRIGAANSKHQQGKGNSQHGTMWITDGVLNRKIKTDALIPEGWRKGRTLNSQTDKDV